MKNYLYKVFIGKSSFRYWAIHWWEYQRTAWKFKLWRPWDILHDIEKPWLNIFLPYKYVRYIHRKISNHHEESIFKVSTRAAFIDIMSGEGSRVKDYDVYYEILKIKNKLLRCKLTLWYLILINKSDF